MGDDVVRIPAGDLVVGMTARGPAEAMARWDDFVARVPGTDVNQLTAWARVRATLGFDALHVTVESPGGELVGGMQVLHRRLPVLGRVGYVPSGPVLVPAGWDAGARRPDVCRALADVCDLLSRKRFRGLFVQPPDDADDVTRALLERGFRTSDAGVAPAGTLRLDLSADEAQLRQGLGRRLRYWTGKWADSGVVVRRGDAGDVGVLAGLMEHSARHQGHEPLPPDYVRAFVDELGPSGNAVLFVAEVDDRVVAADLLTGCGGVLKGRLGGFDRSGRSAKLSVPGALRWTEIRWAKAEGYRWFDFGGIDPGMLDDLLAGRPRDDDRWPSADTAKLSFGGTPFRYPGAVERIRPAALRAAYDAVRGSVRGRAALEAVGQRLRGARTPRPGTAQQK